MSEWSLVGYDRKEAFERNLDPESLAMELVQYQYELGKSFGIAELLELQRIRGLALIAEAINDAPEFLAHHIYQAIGEGKLQEIPESIQILADAVYELKE